MTNFTVPAATVVPATYGVRKVSDTVEAIMVWNADTYRYVIVNAPRTIYYSQDNTFTIRAADPADTYRGTSECAIQTVVYRDGRIVGAEDGIYGCVEGFSQPDNR